MGDTGWRSSQMSDSRRRGRHISDSEVLSRGRKMGDSGGEVDRRVTMEWRGRQMDDTERQADRQ